MHLPSHDIILQAIVSVFLSEVPIADIEDGSVLGMDNDSPSWLSVLEPIGVGANLIRSRAICPMLD